MGNVVGFQALCEICVWMRERRENDIGQVILEGMIPCILD